MLTLRGRAQLLSNNHGFNPRVRFSPDGRELAASCDDWSDQMAVWPGLQDMPANSQERDRIARRRAVRRHLDLARTQSVEALQGRRIALDQLEHARRIGLESPEEFLTLAWTLMELDLWEQADAALDRAVALAPRDDRVLNAAAQICSQRGRFDRARAWYDRIPDPTASLTCAEIIDQCAAFVVAGDLARYRQFCVEMLRRLETDQIGRWDAGNMAYTLALGPDPGSGALDRLWIARRAYDGLGAAHPYDRASALLAPGAASVRAGAPERAEPLFREVIATPPPGDDEALATAWMAIATWHQGAATRSWFARGDRFMPARASGGRSGLADRTPFRVFDGDWCRILIARREAHGLLLDADFPADPFGR